MNPILPAHPLAFIDVEATSLLPAMHPEGKRPWEIAIIRRTPDFRLVTVVYVDVDITHAEPLALTIGGYHDRHPAVTGRLPRYDGASVHRFSGVANAGVFVATLLDGATLIGANPGYDADALSWLIHQSRPLAKSTPWHYRPYCVTTVGGALAGMTPPFHSGDVAKWLGVDRVDYQPEHTALADALWAEAQYDAITARTEVNR